MIERIRHRVFNFLELSVAGDKWGRVFDNFMILLIISNVLAIILETVASISQAYGDFFFAFEIFSVAIFTVEYVARVWACTANEAEGLSHPVWGRLRYMSNPMAVIDLLAFLPFYLSAFFGLDLRMLRVFRLLRLLKLTRYSPALAVIWAVLVGQHKALTAALLVMLTALLFSSSIVYLLERGVQPDKFSSIPEAMWWGIATLTTVGYGDVTPITPLGRFFGAVTMIMGIGMFALPTGVIATGFSSEIRKRDFMVNWRLVSSVPLFTNLDAPQIADIVSLLTPLVVPPKYAVVRLGDEADTMYFIVAGRVEVEIYPKPVELEVGDYFGEIGILEKRHRTTAVIALTECQLLELRAEDFWDLLEKHPAIHDELKQTMAQRLAELEASGEDDTF